MRIFFSIAVGMMHSMHNGVCPWNKKRRPLDKPCHQVKCFFPSTTCGIHLVGSKSV
jgi:hypothetical protein